MALDVTHDAPGAHERLFWRRLARWGSADRPDWWLRMSPPFFGWAAAAFVPSARRAVSKNLRRVRGPVSPLRDARDVLHTFGTYASCLAETLSNDGAKSPRRPSAVVHGERFFREASAKARGLVIVTAHTAGWESVGPLLGRDYGLDMMLVMHAEPDARAGALQDHARRRTGVSIAHVGDPLASLPLLRHLKGGGVVALQLDRVVPGMRTRAVRFLDEPGSVPEGPLRLAQLSGAAVLPIFCARTRYREYLVEAFAPRFIARRASEEVLNEAAQHFASSMTTFLRRHPTQWFQFGGG